MSPPLLYQLTQVCESPEIVAMPRFLAAEFVHLEKVRGKEPKNPIAGNCPPAAATAPSCP